MTESYSVNAERGVNALKIKYFTFSGQDYGGVNKKLFSQAAELIHLGLDVELILIRVGDVRYPSYDFLTVYTLDKIPMNDFLGRIKRACKISKIFSTTEVISQGV